MQSWTDWHLAQTVCQQERVRKIADSHKRCPLALVIHLRGKGQSHRWTLLKPVISMASHAIVLNLLYKARLIKGQHQNSKESTALNLACAVIMFVLATISPENKWLLQSNSIVRSRMFRIIQLQGVVIRLRSSHNFLIISIILNR